MAAAANDHHDCVQLLLQAGADPSARSKVVDLSESKRCSLLSGVLNSFTRIDEYANVSCVFVCLTKASNFTVKDACN